MKKTLQWFISNGVVGGLIWVGVYEGNAGAGRMLVFLAWLYALLGLLSVGDAAIKHMRDSGPLPRPLQSADGVLHGSFVVTTIWQGWWLTGLALVLAYVCIAAARAQAFPEQKATA